MDIRVLLVKFMGKPNLNKSIGAFQLILQIMNDIYLYISTLYTIKSTRPATVRHFESRLQPVLNLLEGFPGWGGLVMNIGRHSEYLQARTRHHFTTYLRILHFFSTLLISTGTSRF